MSKVIWYFFHYAGGPEIGRLYRPYQLAQEWKKLGCEPYIFCASSHHLQYSFFRQETFKTELNGIHYIFLKTSFYKKNSFGRIWNMLEFIYRLYHLEKSGLDIPIPNTIIASIPHPLTIFPAIFFSKKFKAQFLLEIRDIWQLVLTDLFNFSSKNLLTMVVRMIENYGIFRANKIISALPNFNEFIEKKSKAKKRVLYIPNAVSLDDYLKDKQLFVNSPVSKFIEKLRMQGKFLIAYTGGMRIANALDDLLEAAILIQPVDKNACFLLIGEGNQKIFLEKRTSSLQLNNVFFFDSVEKSEISNLLKKVDAAFIGWLDKPLYKYGISPNKICDYMAAGLPIIHSTAITKNLDLVYLANCGISVPPGNPEKLSNAVLTLINMDKAQRNEIGERGKEYVKQFHDYEQLAKQYLDFIEIK